MIRYLETFFRNRWIITLPALVLLFSGSALVLTTPRLFTASSLVWTEQSSYLGVQSGNVWQTPAQIQSGRFKEFVSTSTFSRAIVERTNIGETGTEDEMETLAYDIRTSMKIWTTGDHSVYIGFSHTDPELALQVVQASVEEYNNAKVASESYQATSAVQFYQDRIKLYEEQILPKSSSAVQAYLESHPELRRNLQEGASYDSQYVLLAQAAERDRATYEQYKQRLDEIMAQSDAVLRAQDLAFRFVDPPELAPGGGNISKRQMVLFAGAGAGLAMGYVALFLLLGTELDPTLRNPGDVRRRLHIPVLEIVPDYSKRQGMASRIFHKRRMNRRQILSNVKVELS
jgi:uncharacterized protein involved in exopolysaccharide biosynthesis